jgi:hypothetical protein
LYPDDDEVPVLSLALAIQKRQAVVALLEITRAGRTEELLAAHSAEIEAIQARHLIPRSRRDGASPARAGRDRPDAWPERLTTLEMLVKELAPRLKAVGDAAGAARIEQMKSSVVELNVVVSPDGATTTEKTSLWDRLRGKGRSQA